MHIDDINARGIRLAWLSAYEALCRARLTVGMDIQVSQDTLMLAVDSCGIPCHEIGLLLRVEEADVGYDMLCSSVADPCVRPCCVHSCLNCSNVVCIQRRHDVPYLAEADHRGRHFLDDGQDRVPEQSEVSGRRFGVVVATSLPVDVDEYDVDAIGS